MVSQSALDACLLSVKVAFFSQLLIIIPGVVVAWLLARKQFVGKSMFEALVHAPLVLPPVVTGYLLLLSLGRNSFMGSFLENFFGIRLAFNFFGAVLAATVVSFPLLVRPLRQAIEMVPPQLEITAATLGASPLKIFISITLPLSWPGLVTGLTLAFARGLGEFGATIIFAGNIQGETQTLPLAIYTQMQVPQKDHVVLMLAMISIFFSLLALFVSEWYTKRRQQRFGGSA